MRTVWQERVDNATKKGIDGRIFAGFNTNVDVVVHLNEDNVNRLVEDVSMAEVNQADAESIEIIRTKVDFVAILKDCLGKGKSFYIVLADMGLLAWLDGVFIERKESMGGQAGIIANQMAALEAQSTVYTSLFSQKQVDMFFPEVLAPKVDQQLALVPVGQTVRPADNLKINWIFEYAKGVPFRFADEQVVTPRANRVILATRPPGVVMGFTGAVADHLPELGKHIDVAFMAGYHYAPAEDGALQEYMEDCLEGIRQLKIGNPNIRLHFEYVPMKDTEAEKYMLTCVAQEIQSFGINENEIKRVLQEFGFHEEFEQVHHNERAFALYQGALQIARKLGFERIQVHNLGYYVLVLQKPYAATPEQVREACLYASAVNAMKARYGGYVKRETVAEAAELDVSDIGLNQLAGFAKDMTDKGYSLPPNFVEEGIVEFDDHYALVVPAHVVPNPVSTVGMGDTISSSSYALEASFSLVK